MLCKIITHPPLKNYGGILQAYALSSAIKQAGHSVSVINGPHKKNSLKKHLTIALARLLGKNKDARFENLKKFVNKHIPLTEKWYGEYIPCNDCVIVGSDQVWRPDYTHLLEAYFLDFLKDESNVKKIAYAASLGVDEWLLSETQTKECGDLIRLFDAVSVRESSAVTLLNKHWQIEAKQMPDPTLLHDADFYRNCFASYNAPQQETLFTYFLDPNEEKIKFTEKLASRLGVPLFNFMPVKKKSKLLPVEHFLSGIEQSKMVVTDSFHGMVFSMIFTKPFAVTGNEKRGMTRFQLANDAGCGDALLNGDYSIDHCLSLATAHEYFAATKKFLLEERIRGRAFLQENIGGSFLPYP